MRWALVFLLACGGGGSSTDVGVDAFDAGVDAFDAGFDAGFDAAPDPRVDMELYELVDPFIGTDNTGFWSPNCYPGAVAPFGLVSASPDTRREGGMAWFEHAAGYHWDDDQLLGFSHNRHQGTSTPDLGVVLLVPVRDDVAGPRSRPLPGYDHADEAAEPGYYALRLDDPAVLSELTVTERSAHHRYRFEGSGGKVVLDLGHALPDTEVVDASLSATSEGTMTGWVDVRGRFTRDASDGTGNAMRTYFALRTRAVPTAIDVWSGGLRSGGLDATGPEIGVVLSFGESSVEIQVALSYVDVAGAEANLDSEVPGWDFDATRAATRAAWEAELGVVDVEGGSGAEREIFATALYHSFVVPSLTMDADARYRGLDGVVHDAVGFEYHSFFSLWDTYRTVHPLLTLVHPERQRNMMRSLMAMAEDGGYVPRWPFGHAYTNSTIGAGGEITLAESVLKGIDLDAAQVLDLVLRAAEAPTSTGHPYGGREGVEDYVTLGWVPSDRGYGRTVSRTQEFAVADAAIARLAERVGRSDVADRFRPRGQSYANVYDEELGLFRPRNSDGSFVIPFDPSTLDEADGYYGGNARHYAYMAPHDPVGLRDLYGSDRLRQSLEDLFVNGRDEIEDPGPLAELAPTLWYNHGNEPGIHAAYLFLTVGRPDLAQEWVAWVMRAYYSDTPAGIRGNEDAGTLSAWYVWSALGLYPWPGRDLYFVNRPIFERATLEVRGGQLVIETEGEGAHVQSVTLDGVPLDRPWVRHDEIADGATLHFMLGPDPSSWGRDFGAP